MAQISLDSILGFFPAGDIFSRRNDVKYWSGWVSQDGPDRKVKVTAVSFEENGLELSLDDNGTTHKLKAVPKDESHTAVSFDDAAVAGASLVFALKGTLLNPTRFGFDFRPIPLNGNPARFNMRYDP